MEQLQIVTKTATYPVVVGVDLFHQFGTYVKQLATKPSAFFIIVDENVAPYLPKVTQQLESFRYYVEIIPSGEQSKSFAMYERCLTSMLEARLDRKSVVIAFGGGVIGDLAGFVAASFMRGIPFIQIPTTLLAHDSAVGGKTGINHSLGKNLIGAFHQPSFVFYDVALLQTLSTQQWRSGYAELVKHALISDEAFLTELVTTIPSLADVELVKWPALIARGIAVKAKIVAQDEREASVRAFLNFGHTLGHALENVHGYGTLAHGEAVAIGMLFALRLSERHFNVSLPYDVVRDHLQQLQFPLPSHLRWDVPALVEAMKLDKKAMHAQIHFVLLSEVGTCHVVPIDEETLTSALASWLEEWSL